MSGVEWGEVEVLGVDGGGGGGGVEVGWSGVGWGGGGVEWVDRWLDSAPCLNQHCPLRT